MLYRLLSLFFVCLSALPLAAQQATVPLGQWQSFLSSQGAFSVSAAGNRIYFSSQGGFYYLDQNDNSLNSLSKIDGFSDVGVQKIGHDPQTGITLIAYRNTNLDLLLPDGRIVNINDIQQKAISGNKQIRSIYFHQNLAYLSTSFGVVVIDLLRYEVKDTYSNLGSQGQVLDIAATTILNDSIYLAASNSAGSMILRARLSNNNLLDYNNWSAFDSSAGLPAGGYISTLATYQNKVFAGINFTGVYYYNGAGWQQSAATDFSGTYLSMTVYADRLLIAAAYHVLDMRSPATFTIIDHPLLESPLEAVKDANGTLWVADYHNGLIKVNGQQAEAIKPEGPAYTIAFDLLVAENTLYVAGGGYNRAESYVPMYWQHGFYEYKQGQWTNYNQAAVPDSTLYPNIRDIVALAYSPATKSLYLGSHGYGLIKWNGPGNFTVYNDSNSPLLSTSPTLPNQVRVGGLVTDAEGVVWVVNRHTLSNTSLPSLFGLHPDGTWESHSFPGFRDAGFLEKITLDDFGNKWIVGNPFSSAGDGGLLLYNSKDRVYKHLLKNNFARLPSTIVNCITRDLDGAMWVGTEGGVAVYYSPGLLLSGTYNSDPRPIIDGRYLFEDQSVNDIAVDGGNRKWIASNDGVWLFNETGTELIKHFTVDNSPLPSNKVNKLAINHQTGEVFIATEEGLVSYRSDATLAETDATCKALFPNPVRLGFTGLVNIGGVPANSLIKITDANGVLVHQVKANGNTAVWNLHDYKGRKVAKGVYLIMATSADGAENMLCKLAVLD